MTLERGESAPPHVSPTRPAGPTRESRATTTFLAGGLLTLGFLLLFGGILSTAPPIRGFVVVGGVVLGLLAMLGTALGLAQGRGWAVAVMTPILQLLVLAGTVEVIWALAHGAIHIPFGALLAIWALQAPIGSRGSDGPRTSGWRLAGSAAFGAMLLSAAWPVVGSVLVIPGGPLVASRDALQPSFVITCDSAPGTAPTFVRVEYGWRWARAEPLAAGTDSVVLTWYVVREDGLIGYVAEASAPLGDGISEANVQLTPSGSVYSVDLGLTQFEPRSIAISLVSTSAEAPEHGSIEIQALYLHAPADIYGFQSPATWSVNSSGRCEW